jgi:hypothetical protein
MQEFGHLLEAYFITEMLQQVSWLDDIAGTGHRRTHEGAEVDRIIERRDGALVAIEVRAGSHLTTEDLTGLRAIRGASGDAFHTGVVRNWLPGLPCEGPHPGPAYRPSVEPVARHRAGRPVALHVTETTMTGLSQFLIVFNHEQGALHQDVAVVADAAVVLRVYDAAERHFAEQEHIEVVLIGSDSLDTVRRTHANEFDGTAALERLLPAG